MHPLKNKIAIDVDDQVGIGNLGGVRIEGRPIEVAFFEPVGAGGDAGRANVKEIDTWRSFGRLAGLRFVVDGWGWTTSMSGSAAALKASRFIDALEADGKRRIDVVEYDVETKDIAWQKEFLLGKFVADGIGTKGIRGANGMLPDPTRSFTLGYRWGRPGVWTIEGRQDIGTSEAALAAESGLLVGPQLYDGSMNAPMWSYHYELRTWCRGDNPGKSSTRIPFDKIIPYTDARRENRLSGESECVLFATSRLTELF